MNLICRLTRRNSTGCCHFDNAATNKIFIIIHGVLSFALHLSFFSCEVAAQHVHFCLRLSVCPSQNWISSCSHPFKPPLCPFIPLNATLCPFMPLYAPLCPFLPIFAHFCPSLSLFAPFCPFLPLYAPLSPFKPLYASVCPFTLLYTSLHAFTRLISWAAPKTSS